MKILIVDDDRFVIAALKKKIEWEKYGFSEVLTAHSMSEAQTVIASNHPDILISDINMPRGSGLDLLAWIKEHQKKIITILLTSYTDFEYAKRAVELGAFKYVLKPIDKEELTATICDAVAELKKQNIDIEEKYHVFWRKLMLRESPVGELDSMYPEEAVFTPLLFTFDHYYLDSENRLLSRIRSVNNGEMTRIFKSSFSDILKKGDTFIPIHEGSHISYAAVLQGEQDHDLLDKCCMSFIDSLKSLYNCPSNVYAGSYASINDIREQFNHLEDYMKNDLTSVQQAVFVPKKNAHDPATGDPQLPASHIDYMIRCMSDGDYDSLAEYVHQYLEEIAALKYGSATAISNFQIDFVQALYSTLREKGISANHLYRDETYHTLSSEAVLSIYNMELYLQYMLNGAERFINASNGNKSVGKIIKDYVDKHYMEDINRQSLSQILYLDPDYASKLFKNEIGISFTNYVIEKRIEIAKDLLRTTLLPISTIASEVGYDNYSYFTRLFKKQTGSTPVEFRMQVKNN